MAMPADTAAGLEEQLLADYGTVPQTIGACLLRRNGLDIGDIQSICRLSPDEVRDGLSVLIQRRLVAFSVVGRAVKYFLDKHVLKKRLFFPMYARAVLRRHPGGPAEYFLGVLTRGILGEQRLDGAAAPLLHDGILQTVKSDHTGLISGGRPVSVEEPAKVRRLAGSFLVVNFARVEQLVFEDEMAAYIGGRYNRTAADIFRAVCTDGDVAAVRTALQSSKVLIRDGEAILNEPANIEEYLKYLTESGLVHVHGDVASHNDVASYTGHRYSVNYNTKTLKARTIGLLLRTAVCRRLFRMVLGRDGIEDRSVTTGSLLMVNTIKESMLGLLRLGLIEQRCKEEYRNGHRMEYLWGVDMPFACRQLGSRLERRLAAQQRELNEDWCGYATGADRQSVSLVLSMSRDILILGME